MALNEVKHISPYNISENTNVMNQTEESKNILKKDNHSDILSYYIYYKEKEFKAEI